MRIVNCASCAVIDWSVNLGDRVAKRTRIGNNRDVLQSVFPLVVFGAVALSIVMSLVFLFSRGSAYDQIGDSGFAPERDPGDEAPAPPPGSSALRNERRSRQGLEQLDVDAEVQRTLTELDP